MVKPWKLYYWGCAGRAEFIRLLFEEAGVKYEEVNDVHIIKDALKTGEGQWPVMSVPMIESQAGLKLSHTPGICKYLGKQFNLAPDKPLEEAKADQVMGVCNDFINEITRWKVGEVSNEKMKQERIPKFLDHFDSCLIANRGGTGLYTVGLKPNYSDFALMYVLRICEEVLGEEWGTEVKKFRYLQGFKQRMEGREHILAYHSSPRAKPTFIK